MGMAELLASERRGVEGRKRAAFDCSRNPPWWHSRVQHSLTAKAAQQRLHPNAAWASSLA
jgi:hypothetical protein